MSKGFLVSAGQKRLGSQRNVETVETVLMVLMMADLDPSKRPLEVLPAMLNQVVWQSDLPQGIVEKFSVADTD